MTAFKFVKIIFLINALTFCLLPPISFAELWNNENSVTVAEDNDDVKINGSLQIGPYATISSNDSEEGAHLSAFFNTDGARVSLEDNLLLLQAGPNSDVMLMVEEEGVWMNKGFQVEADPNIPSTCATTIDADQLLCLPIFGVWSVFSNCVVPDDASVYAYQNDGAAINIINRYWGDLTTSMEFVTIDSANNFGLPKMIMGIDDMGMTWMNKINTNGNIILGESGSGGTIRSYGTLCIGDCP